MPRQSSLGADGDQPFAEAARKRAAYNKSAASSASLERSPFINFTWAAMA